MRDLLLALLCLAPLPLYEPPATPRPWSPPDLRGAWINGTSEHEITQHGQAFTITGCNWGGHGYVYATGPTIVVWWINEAGRDAVSVYRVCGDELLGEWRYGGLADGELSLGPDTCRDRMRRPE